MLFRSPRALEIAAAITAEWARARALSGVGPRLAPEHQPRALEIAAAITNEEVRARALFNMIPQ